MKKQNILAEIKALDIKSLAAKAKAIRAEIGDLILDKNMNKLKDLKVISKKRKELAQTFTVLKQKQIIESLEKTEEKGAKEK
jgi:ribosomal protein L29